MKHPEPLQAMQQAGRVAPEQMDPETLAPMLWAVLEGVRRARNSPDFLAKYHAWQKPGQGS